MLMRSLLHSILYYTLTFLSVFSFIACAPESKEPKQPKKTEDQIHNCSAELLSSWDELKTFLEHSNKQLKQAYYNTDILQPMQQQSKTKCDAFLKDYSKARCVYSEQGQKYLFEIKDSQESCHKLSKRISKNIEQVNQQSLQNLNFTKAIAKYPWQISFSKDTSVANIKSFLDNQNSANKLILARTNQESKILVLDDKLIQDPARPKFYCRFHELKPTEMLENQKFYHFDANVWPKLLKENKLSIQNTVFNQFKSINAVAVQFGIIEKGSLTPVSSSLAMQCMWNSQKRQEPSWAEFKLLLSPIFDFSLLKD